MATAAVLEAIEARRQQIREQAAWAIAGIETKRDAELAQLNPDPDEQPAVAAAAPPAPETSSAPRKPKSRKGKGGGSVQAMREASAKRADDLYRFLAQKGGQVGPAEAREALGCSKDQVRVASLRLIEEGRMTKTGERQFTKYEAITGGAPSTSSTPPPAPAPPSGPPAPATAGGGTLQGQLLSRVVGLGGQGQSVAELAEFAGISQDEVRSTMGKLIREEEVELKRRDGDTVYVPGRAG